MLWHSTFQWLSLMFQLLDACSSRLKMACPARTLYTPKGELIQSWDDIERDMVICVSSGRGFITQKGIVTVSCPSNFWRIKAFILFFKELTLHCTVRFRVTKFSFMSLCAGTSQRTLLLCRFQSSISLSPYPRGLFAEILKGLAWRYFLSMNSEASEAPLTSYFQVFET